MPWGGDGTLRGYGRAQRVVVVFALAATLVTWAVAGGWLWWERHQILSVAADDLRRMSVVTAEQTRRLFSLADVFMAVLDKVVGGLDGSPTDNQMVNDLVEEFRRDMGGVVDIHLIDTAGNLHFLPHDAAAPAYSVGSRGYLGDATVGRMIVKSPVIGVKSGEWLIPVTRRLAKPVGNVAMIVAAIRIPHLERIYDTIRDRRGGAVALLRRDGFMLARAPFTAEMIGKSLMGTALFRDQLPQAPQGLYENISSLDGQRRLVAYQSLDNYGLVLTVSAKMDKVLAPWRQRAWLTLFGVAFISAVIAIGLVVVMRLLCRLADGARNLERRVQDRTAELDAAKRKAEGAAEAKSRFQAAVSHELRTPLNAIIGFSDALVSGAFGPLSQRHHGYVGDIRNSGLYLLALVNDLLDVAAADAGKLHLDEGAVELAAVAAEAMHMVQDRATKAGLTTEIMIEPDWLSLAGDRRRLLQALLNVLSNAVKFNRKGGWVRLWAHLGEAGRCVIEISDGGLGMSAEDVHLALTPFGRANAPAVSAVEGTGLGLPLAVSVVEAHGGTLAIESAVGVGTMVRIVLPAERVLKGMPAQLMPTSPSI
jgi:two-component system, cell cycle sensor histidine kinase PleC